MHENSPTLTAKKRERLGSRYCKRIRDNGGLPAIVYGHGEQPVPIIVEARNTLRLINSGEKVFTINLEGGFQNQTVLLKDLQFDYLGTNIVHADFARVDMNERVTTRVSVHLVGEAPGLKKAGAVMIHPTTELEIECSVVELPDFIEVSVRALEADGTIYAKDVELPSKNMKLLTDGQAVVAHIVVQVEQPTAEATEAGAAAAPEVLTAKKPEGDAAAKTDAKKK